MPIYKRTNGVLSPAAAEIFYVSEGVPVQIAEGRIHKGGVTTLFYVHERIVTLSNAEQVDISTLFSSADWAASMPKRVIIPPGVTIGSTSASVPALRTGTGRGGKLIIENAGSILAAGGAPNSGNGGHAFAAEQAGVEFFNSGELFGGGAGGGRGGQGGPGYYQYWRDNSGWEYSHVTNTYWRINGQTNYIYWHNQIWIVNGYISSHQVGNYLYVIGAYKEAGTGYFYYIKQQVLSTAYTTGGAPGAGGRGRGYNQTPLSGSPGSAGGTNAGAGGTGGAGAEWGLAGATGATGASGNNGAGSAGAAGGLPGAAILNPANVNLTNTGDIRGAA